MDEELKQLIAELIDEGMDPDEAEEEARFQLYGGDVIRDDEK
jgi:hypothetical protein